MSTGPGRPSGVAVDVRDQDAMSPHEVGGDLGPAGLPNFIRPPKVNRMTGKISKCVHVPAQVERDGQYVSEHICHLGMQGIVVSASQSPRLLY